MILKYQVIYCNNCSDNNNNTIHERTAASTAATVQQVVGVSARPSRGVRAARRRRCDDGVSIIYATSWRGAAESVSADVLLVKVLMTYAPRGDRPHCGVGDVFRPPRAASFGPINNRVLPKRTFTVDPLAAPTGTHTPLAALAIVVNRIFFRQK